MSTGVTPAGTGCLAGAGAAVTAGAPRGAVVVGRAGSPQALHPAMRQAGIARQSSWQQACTPRSMACACCRHSRIANDRATRKRMARTVARLAADVPRGTDLA